MNGDIYARAAGMADLIGLLDAGWIVQLGQARVLDESPAGYYLAVRRRGDLVSVNFTAGTVPEAALKARDWAAGTVKQGKAKEHGRD